MVAPRAQGAEALSSGRDHRGAQRRYGLAPRRPARRGERLSGLYDSHCHLDFDALGSDPGVARRALDAGVTHLLVPGVDEAQWARAEQLDARGLSLRFAVGVHPRHEGSAEKLAAWVERIGAAALGEVGWHRGVPHRDALVDAHAELARERSLPLILHVVGAHGHALERLRRHAPLRGVVHAYSGSAELVREYVDLGLHVSVGPSVLNETARRVRAACLEIPEERLLIETDSPDQIGEPADLRAVASEVAAIRGQTLADLASSTTRNATLLFGPG